MTSDISCISIAGFTKDECEGWVVIVSVSCDVRSVKGAMVDASLVGVLRVAEVLVSEFKSVLGAMEDASLVGILGVAVVLLSEFKFVPGVMEHASLVCVIGVAEVLLSEFKSVLGVMEDASVRSCSGGIKFNVSVWSDTVVEQGGYLKSSV